jgi:hypothetical protein
MVVFGAASFIRPGSIPNYFRLAVEYLRRPRCDVLEMIAQNKGVFGFNLIWCALACNCAVSRSQLRCRMWDKMDLMRDMLADMFERVRWRRAQRIALESRTGDAAAYSAADEMARATCWSHAAIPRRQTGPRSAAKRENNRKSAARSEPPVKKRPLQPGFRWRLG